MYYVIMVDSQSHGEAGACGTLSHVLRFDGQSLFADGRHLGDEIRRRMRSFGGFSEASEPHVPSNHAHFSLISSFIQ
jgi:hypothetical protein